MKKLLTTIACFAVFASCIGGGRANSAGSGVGTVSVSDGDGATETASASASTKPDSRVAHAFSPSDIVIEKQLTYDQHTLADTFAYKGGQRMFQFDKMRERLFLLDSIQQASAEWGILQNRKNENGRPANARGFTTDEYHTVSDRYGVEGSQSAPLYAVGEFGSGAAERSGVPERYGRDGSLVRLIGRNADATAYRVESYNAPGEWEVPNKYVKPIPTTEFAHVVMVDRTNQAIATLERTGRGHWLVRSMNPCTTGEHTPPHAYPTPTGMFVIQDREAKMMYTNGGPAIVGFAPWASRFTNGAFLHGVPVNNPHGAIVEFSSTLGTVPRSHECVRNAASHAKFIYDTMPVEESIVFVYD